MVSVCVGAEWDSNPLKVMIVSLQLIVQMKMKNVCVPSARGTLPFIVSLPA